MLSSQLRNTLGLISDQFKFEERVKDNSLTIVLIDTHKEIQSIFDFESSPVLLTKGVLNLISGQGKTAEPNPVIDY